MGTPYRYRTVPRHVWCVVHEMQVVSPFIEYTPAVYTTVHNGYDAYCAAHFYKKQCVQTSVAITRCWRHVTILPTKRAITLIVVFFEIDYNCMTRIQRVLDAISRFDI